jgi:tryptophan-rich sensory protein
MIIRVIIFLILNFAALALGAIFTEPGVSSEWYSDLNKAPWTPPGWVFGVAWTTIMLLFSTYMAILWGKEVTHKSLAGIFITQWVLNIGWNPVFFTFNLTILALIIISALTVIIGYCYFRYRPVLGWSSALLLPYFVWLILATSLNLYIVVQN